MSVCERQNALGPGTGPHSSCVAIHSSCVLHKLPVLQRCTILCVRLVYICLDQRSKFPAGDVLLQQQLSDLQFLFIHFNPFLFLSSGCSTTTEPGWLWDGAGARRDLRVGVHARGEHAATHGIPGRVHALRCDAGAQDAVVLRGHESCIFAHGIPSSGPSLHTTWRHGQERRKERARAARGGAPGHTSRDAERRQQCQQRHPHENDSQMRPPDSRNGPVQINAPFGY
jgi:hypothetical protein